MDQASLYEKRGLLYQKVIGSALTRVRSGRMLLKIPRTQERYRRIPRSHFHPRSEIFFQLGGATDFECPGESFRVKSPQLCIMPHGIAHAETPVNLRTSYEILVFGHYKEGFSINHATSPDGGRILGNFTDPRVTSRGRDAFHYLDEIAAETIKARERRKIFVEGLLVAFLVTLLEELEQPMQATLPTCSPKIMEVENLVRAHLSEPDLSVAMLAESMRCSADYLSRHFHEERKMTLSRWILQERVAMARELLSDPRYNIAEVGWACGFNSPSYFIHVFRQHTNLTPLAYREAEVGNG